MTVAVASERRVVFESMATQVELRVIDPGPHADDALAQARDEVEQVVRHLSRFDDRSALSQVNSAPGSWHRVPDVLREALREAERAHRATDGLFDPRVLDALLAWGYDHTFDEMTPTAQQWDTTRLPEAHPVHGRWRPELLDAGLVRTGAPIDLGGIGKGLAVRRAAAALTGAGTSVLVNAGGDDWLGGMGPDGTGWTVAVEDPHGGTDPVAVLRLADLACATSSIRRRRWTSHGTVVHHLVNPRTGTPGGEGIASVTVVHIDPAWAEVWSKSLFLAGRQIAAEVRSRGIAALWVDDDGEVHVSEALAPAVVHRRSSTQHDAR